MTRNEGAVDRTLRVILGSAAIIAAGLVGWSSVLGIILAIVGVVLVVTGLVGFCPLYSALNISTTTSASDLDRGRVHH
jgi:uncharacterized membrane protein